MLNAANWTARLNELATDANVPGAALGIWSDGQEVLAAHGVLNAATQVPVTTDSVFQVGSITKIWTATMIMQLVDQGLLSLDTTVSEVLPGAARGGRPGTWQPSRTPSRKTCCCTRRRLGRQIRGPLA
jgi:CubicO group peptidase (beta-lactamase class C family)